MSIDGKLGRKTVIWVYFFLLFLNLVFREEPEKPFKIPNERFPEKDFISQKSDLISKEF